jgi:hypothetical protein
METDIMMRVLQVDRAGAPVEWLSLEKAAHHESKGNVSWSLGDPCTVLRGGTNAHSGLLSTLALHPIISLKDSKFVAQNHKTPALSRVLVFRRDKHICAYCGDVFKEENLTLDHVHPKSRGGADSFANLVSACKHCNGLKDCKRPEEAKMPLLYVPYVPNIHEAFILRNKTILFDQMEFLMQSVPKHSRLRS